MATERPEEQVKSVFDERLAELEQDLEALLERRRRAERAVSATEEERERCKSRLAEILKEEGALRGKIGDARRALEAAREL